MTVKMYDIDKIKDTIIHGDTLETLKKIPDNSIDAIITSPPYWGLRDYGESTYKVWGGDPNCKHEWEEIETKRSNASGGKTEYAKQKLSIKGKYNYSEFVDYHNRVTKSSFCKKCGAWYGQLGLEPTLDLYLVHLWQISDELYRVLKPTGVMFWVHGDSYSQRGECNPSRWKGKEVAYRPAIKMANLPPKCLALQNYRFILGLIDVDYRILVEWKAMGKPEGELEEMLRHPRIQEILRNTIIWHKPNHMPSSVKDRFTNAYEPVFMLVKNKKYWFDLDAVRVPYKQSTIKRAEIFIKNNESFSQERHKTDEYGKYQNPVQILENTIKKGLNPLGKNPGDVFAVPYDFIPGILTREEAAYIAGLLDADGCIIIQQKKTNNIMWINITNTNRSVLEWIRDRVGFGKVSERKRKDKWRTIFEYITYGKNAGALLYAIYPWLQIKKERAKTALEFQSLTVGVGQYLDEGAKERRRQLLEEMHKLNQGEIEKSSSPDPLFYNIKGDVWTIPTQPFPDSHFAVFPPKLVEPMIKASCPDDGIVLDPFAGSGTTLYVARKLGRHYIGIELNPEYVKMAEKRLSPLKDVKRLEEFI